MSVLEKASIKRIIDLCNIREDIKENWKLKSIAEGILNEANIEYYRAYKKAILDYILEDPHERERTAIDVVFRPAPTWGKPKAKNSSSVTIERASSEAERESIKEEKNRIVKKLSEHLYYPKCIL